ncbi:MAG: hypothetical protein LE168_02375 [Endomicrobium sp.]|nr:hypothetical protein [Endomicrobium sp.]
MNGFDLAHKLHESGYARLWMMTGTIFEKHEVPTYLKVAAKDTKDIEYC